MEKKVMKEWFGSPRSNEMDIWLLKRNPEVFVYMLQDANIAFEDQLKILAVILDKYGQLLSDKCRDFLKIEVEALELICYR